MSQVVLVVDDEQDILDAFRVLVEGVLDVKVLATVSGTDGLDLLERHDPDLVVSDFRMPGMDGLQFLAKAYALRPGTPRIMMTAFPDMELAIRALNQARITQFLTKPLHPDSLLDTVRSQLAARQAEANRALALERAARLRASQTRRQPMQAEGGVPA